MIGILLIITYATLLSIGLSWVLTIRYRYEIKALENSVRAIHLANTLWAERNSNLRAEIRRLTPKRDGRGRFA